MLGLIGTCVLIAAGCGSGSDGAQPAATDPLAAASGTTIEPAAAIPAGIEDLIGGHNDPTLDRINLVFAAWGWDDQADFRQFAQTVIDWDGHPTLVSDSGQLYQQGSVPDSERDSIMEGDLGLFGFEPFRSNRNLFNLWLTTDSPAEPYEWLDSDGDPDYFDDQVIVTLARFDDPEHFSRSGLDTSFGEPDALERTADPFANATVAVWPPMAQTALRVIPHELGHAIFGLPDEYLGAMDADVEDRTENWPSCAGSIETATDWWGELIGQYDPMIDIYIDEMVAAGFDYASDPTNVELWRSRNQIAFVEGGCFGVDGSYRSTEDSLMGFETTPAFGLTNRKWMEQVLTLWTGV